MVIYEPYCHQSQWNGQERRKCKLYNDLFYKLISSDLSGNKTNTVRIHDFNTIRNIIYDFMSARVCPNCVEGKASVDLEAALFMMGVKKPEQPKIPEITGY